MNQGHVVLDQKGRSAETSAMSIAAVDLAVAATSLANFLWILVWTKNNKLRQCNLQLGGGWLDSTHYPTTANSGRQKIRLYKLFMGIEQ